tara:strand:- start:82 stop:831 length:750 start_codon:yes stop_codon:yes gene_type:complete
VKVVGSSAKTSFFYKNGSNNLINWTLIYKYKCSSTEIELNNFLKKNELKKYHPVAIFSSNQAKGLGQNGRKWISPQGGIWLSAAYPIFKKDFHIEIFPISIAFFLCEMFYQKSIEVKIKWPNDIFYGTKKLIGFLPKLITRGNKIHYARIGIGMNLNNSTPDEGISLSRILNKKNLSESYWSSKILKVINKAILNNKNEKQIIFGANKFLNKQFLPRGYDNNWSINEIDEFGRLKIFKDDMHKTIKSFT